MKVKRTSETKATAAVAQPLGAQGHLEADFFPDWTFTVHWTGLNAAMLLTLARDLEEYAAGELRREHERSEEQSK